MQGDVDASFTATLRFDGRTTATVASSMLAKQPAASLRLSGERGNTLVINPLAPQRGHALTLEADGKRHTEFCPGPSTYEAQLDAVREALLGKRSFPFPADDFVRSMQQSTGSAVRGARVEKRPAIHCVGTAVWNRDD